MAATGGGEELVSVEMPAPEGWTKKVLLPAHHRRIWE
jgi:hypothetical protein